MGTARALLASDAPARDTSRRKGIGLPRRIRGGSLEGRSGSSPEDVTVRLALKTGLLAAEQLQIALAERSGGKSPRPIQEILLEKGFLTREQLSSLQEKSDSEVLVIPHSKDHAPLGKYEIVRELGRGGMGVVYEA